MKYYLNVLTIYIIILLSKNLKIELISWIVKSNFLIEKYIEIQFYYYFLSIKILHDNTCSKYLYGSIFIEYIFDYIILIELI